MTPANVVVQDDPDGAVLRLECSVCGGELEVWTHDVVDLDDMNQVRERHADEAHGEGR